MTIQHKNIADADLHEMKGAASAAIGKVPVASGAGTSPFGYANPIGSTYFVNYAAPNLIVFPAAYTKINPVTTPAGVAVETTEGVNARITYTGTLTSKFRVLANVSMSQGSGANRDLGLKLHKNGVAIAGSEIFTTASTGVIQLITSIFDISLATNDYIEAFVINKGASGDVSVSALLINILGIRG